MNKLSDEWCTPNWLFDELNKEFNFDIDLCAIKENSKCKTFCYDYLNDKAELGDFQEAINPLHKEIHSSKINVCFMNPPYANPRPFIEKAWEDSKYCKIAALVKCDPSTRWWATFWNYKEVYEITNQQEYYEPAGPKLGCEVRFFPKRIKFDPPKELIYGGDVWKRDNKWIKWCERCNGQGDESFYIACKECQGKGHKELPGPTFPCALLIMDRRGEV